MKLLSCRVDGFGCLRDFSMQFDEKLSCVLEDNGFGKSTLAAFLRAMLYGFQTSRKNAAGLPQRTRYTPWSTGIFGGELVFSANGKTYRVRRTFDRITGTRDTFELTDLTSSVLSTDFSEKLGEELFGINEAGFLRTTYLHGDANFGTLPISIHSKIGTMIENADDLEDSDGAISKLTAELNKLQGKGRIIDRTSENCTAAKREMESLAVEISRLAEIRQKRHETVDAINVGRKREADLRRKIEKSALAEAGRLRAERYEVLKGERADLTAERDAMLSRYHGRRPTREDVAELREKKAACGAIEERIAGIRRRLENEEIRRAIRMFSQDEHDDAAFEKATELRDRLAAVRVGRKNEDAELEQLRKAVAEYRLAGAKSPDSEIMTGRVPAVRKEQTRAEQDPRKKRFVRAAVLCGILLLAGILVGVLGIGNPALMIPAFVTAGLSAVVLTVLLAMRMLLGSESGLPGDGVPTGQPIGELSEYQKLLEKREEAEERSIAAAEEETALTEELRAFLKPYGMGGEDPAADFETVKKYRMVYYGSALPELAASAGEQQAAKDADTELRSAIGRLFADPAGAEPEQLIDRMLTDILRFEAIDASLERNAGEMKEIGELLPTDPERREEDPERWQAELSELTPALDEAVTRKSRFDYLLSKLPDLEERYARQKELLETEEEHLAEAQKRARLLSAARDFLKEAKDAMLERYAGGVASYFEKYGSYFPDTLREYRIDADLLPTFRRDGALREVTYFSDGCRAAADLCLRAALVMAMYEGEKPFLILDDPFSDMDGEHLAQAKELLRRLADDLQIVYFTCHESRKIDR